MQPITLAAIETRLCTYIDADLQSDLFTAKAVKNLQLEGDSILLEIVLGFPLQSIQEEWMQQLRTYLISSFPDTKIDLRVSWQIETHVGQGKVNALPLIKNIIAVASGKGGVGKSTIAVNLALALAQEGAQVGILDADIYGPSQPTMLGINTRPEILDKKTIIPIQQHGIKAMSIGFLVDEKAAVVWRGPMIAMALQQLLNDTQWGALDYLVVDLPPGTGDIQLTLAQKIPVSGALVVTTPQELALKDVRRACGMFEKLAVPLLGVVENMSTHVCSHCGHADALFGEGGAARLAKEFNLPLLSTFPLDKKIGEDTDSGLPPVVKEPTSAYAEQYRRLARRVAAQLSLQTKSYSHKFPKIKVE
jgi:ATP-binding protein involved in chromosome partitioning